MISVKKQTDTGPRHLTKECFYFILGGHAIKENDEWRSTYFSETDNFGCMGDYVRPIAASILYNKNKKSKVIVIGTKKNEVWPGTIPVIKRELVKLNVPPNKISSFAALNSTFWQLMACQKILKNKNAKNIEIGIVSNHYHLPRIQAMVKHLDNLAGLKALLKTKKIKFLSAEKILIKNDSGGWKNNIRKAYSTSLMKKRVSLEKQGIKQIIDGTYQIRKQ